MSWLLGEGLEVCKLVFILVMVISLEMSWEVGSIARVTTIVKLFFSSGGRLEDGMLVEMNGLDIMLMIVVMVKSVMSIMLGVVIQVLIIFMIVLRVLVATTKASTNILVVVQNLSILDVSLMIVFSQSIVQSGCVFTILSGPEVGIIFVHVTVVTLVTCFIHDLL